MQPCISLHLPPEGGEIQQRQFELDHALRPWSSWSNKSALQPPANPNQTVERKSCSRWSKNQKEARDAQEGIAAVHDRRSSLLYGRQAKKHCHTAETRPKAGHKQQGEAQRDPEKCRDPAI